MKNPFPFIFVVFAIQSVALTCMATDPASLLRRYKAEALASNPSFSDFSAEDGRKLYFFEGTKGGERVSCTTCHTSDPKAPGKSRAGKAIEPLAPAVARDRFTDEKKVEKWFRRNCNDVLSRECTAKEKGDFLTFLLSHK